MTDPPGHVRTSVWVQRIDELEARLVCLVNESWSQDVEDAFNLLNFLRQHLRPGFTFVSPESGALLERAVAGAERLIFAHQQGTGVRQGTDERSDETKRARVASNASPPLLAQKILCLIPTRHRDPCVGDLDEEYRTEILPRFGIRYARRWYWWQVAASILPLVGQRIAGIGFVAWLLRAGEWVRGAFGTG